MDLRVVSNDGHVIIFHFFAQTLGVNSIAYIDVQVTVTKLCIMEGRSVIQQDPSPTHIGPDEEDSGWSGIISIVSLPICGLLDFLF